MLRVLVVDDSRFMRFIIKNALQKSGKYTVVGEAETSREAVEKYRELRPDLVTMDIIMPVGSGLNSVRQLFDIDKDARVVMVSATGQGKIVDEATELGVLGFIVKPFKQDVFLEKMNRIVESHGVKPREKE